MIRRAGQPPLRFKGRVLARHEDAARGIVASITLWQRKARGYVATLDALSLTDAVSSETLDEAMSWLEGLCERASEPESLASSATDPARGLAEVAMARRLRILAGEALDHWDRLTESGSA